MTEPTGNAPSGVVHVDPNWGLLTTFSVHLLSLRTHQHGPRGSHYLTHDQAVNALHACMKALGSDGSESS